MLKGEGKGFDVLKGGTKREQKVSIRARVGGGGGHDKVLPCFEGWGIKFRTHNFPIL